MDVPRWIVAVAVALAAGMAHADDGTITATLEAPPPGAIPGGGDESFYRLVGQSAFFQHHTGALTSGNQLDGTQTPGNVIHFIELFPPPSLSDYLGFGYFGVLETVAVDDQFNESVVDRSLIVAFDAGEGGGAFGDLFEGFDEAVLVNAFTAGDDSPEFAAFFDAVVAREDTRGVTSVPEIFEPGETMDLVAFIGGTGGDEGVGVGSLSFVVTSVPEPATALLLAGAGLGVLRRRR